MSLAIHPAQRAYQAALLRGERVIWHSSIQNLFCFGQRFYNEFAGDDLRLVWNYNFPGFMLAYPLHLPEDKRDEPLGFQFDGFAYVVQKTNWLMHQDSNGDIPAHRIIDEIKTWLAQYSQVNNESNAEGIELARAQQFLIDEQLVIPSTVWQQALPPRRH